MAAGKSCGVCCAAPHKYKCPNCYLKYCSVACYKKHAEATCKLLSKVDELVQERLRANDANTLTTDSSDSVAFPYNFGVTESTVMPEKLQLLRRDEGITRCLQNPHLRDLLVNVNSAADPAKAMHDAMLEPLFVELADHCLQVVDGEGTTK